MTAFLHAKPGWVRSLLVEGMLLLVLGILIIVMANLSPAFLTTRNLFNVTRFIAEIGLISLGMTMVILTGGIDLSVGSMLGMCGIVMGALFVAGTHVWLAALIAIALGGLAGFINGALTVATRVHPLVITLATLAIYRGIAQGIAQGDSYRGFPEVFFFLGQGYVGPFPTQLLLFAVLAALAAYVLGRTTFGAPSTPSGTTRSPPASPASRSIACSWPSTRPRAFSVVWPRWCSCRASRARAAIRAPSWSSTSSRRWCSAAPHSPAAGARSWARCSDC